MSNWFYILLQMTANVAQTKSCQYIVDVGSGLGHLARLLAYGYGLKVCCLEAQENLSREARYRNYQFTLDLHILCNQCIFFWTIYMLVEWSFV